MKKCPYCSEEVQENAKKCRYCGEWFDEGALAKKIKKGEKKEERYNDVEEEGNTYEIKEKKQKRKKIFKRRMRQKIF